MRPILLVRNDRYESFGTVPAALAWAGADVRSVHLPNGAPLPPLEDVAAVVMFGGTANVDMTERFPFLAAARAYTREAVERAVPYLGICLGSQILARSMGRAVVPSPMKEVGFEPLRPLPAAADDPLVAIYSDGDMAVQWHEDTHELPEGATHLIGGDRIPVQAYRVGDLAWGVQFHQEVDSIEFAQWLDIAGSEMDVEAVWGKSIETLRDESKRFMPDHEARGRQLFGRFARLVLGREPS